MSINLHFRPVVAVLLGFLLLNAHAGPESAHPFVISGVVINSGASKLLDRFVAHLSRESGYRMQPVFVSTYSELSTLLRNDPGAVGWTCGAPFVEDHIKDRQQLISVPLFNGKPLYYSLIMRAVGRPEQSLADFHDKVFAYSDPRSNSGFLAPSYLLEQQGIDIHKHFHLLLHAGNHERSIEALLNGLADVAAIDEYVWVEYLKVHPQASQSLQVIEHIGPYPFTPLVAGAAVSAQVVERLQASLRNMPESLRGKKLLRELGFDGFVEQPVSFYQPIKSMMEAMKWPLE